MALMRSFNRQGVCHRNGLRLGLKVEKSVENGGVVEHFFGKDGNGRLQHDKFVQLLRDLHDEVFKFTPLLSYPARLSVPFCFCPHIISFLSVHFFYFYLFIFYENLIDLLSFSHKIIHEVMECLYNLLQYGDCALRLIISQHLFTGIPFF